MKKILAILAMAAALPGFARGRVVLPISDLNLGDMVSSGTACADPSNLYLELVDGQLYVEFYALEARMGGGSAIARETCTVAIPVTYPKGMKIVISDPDQYGSARTGGGASAVARTELFTTGGSGDVLESRPSSSGPFEDSLSGVVHESGCSGSAILRLNSSVRVTSFSRGRGSIALDGLTANVSLEPCGP